MDENDMKSSLIRGQIRRTVKKWAAREKTARGKVRVKPQVLLSFIPTLKNRPRVSADILLYHKPKKGDPYTEYIQTTNSFGELVLALETILDEWRTQSGYA